MPKIKKGYAKEKIKERKEQERKHKMNKTKKC